MFLEQVHSHDSCDTLSGLPPRQVTNSFLETPMSQTVVTEMVGSRLDEALTGHVAGEHLFNDQVGWVRNSVLRPLDSESDAHTVLVFHGLQNVHLAKYTPTYASYQLFLFFPQHG